MTLDCSLIRLLPVPNDGNTEQNWHYSIRDIHSTCGNLYLSLNIEFIRYARVCYLTPAYLKGVDFLLAYFCRDLFKIRN